MDRQQRRQDDHYERDEEHPRREDPRPVEDFEVALGEEASVSSEFDLPLCVLVARSQDGWFPDAARQVVAVLRAGDLVAQPEPAEISVALPNTELADAEIVERRLRGVLPEISTGIAAHRAGDTVADLLNRARGAVARKTR